MLLPCKISTWLAEQEVDRMLATKLIMMIMCHVVCCYIDHDG